MPRLFSDTSAIVNLYKTEPNSADVRAIVTAAAEVLVSPTLALEFRSAFAILERMAVISPTDAAAFVSAFASHRAANEIVPIGASLLSVAERLLDTYAVSLGLRPLDAIQVASALGAHGVDPLDALVATDSTMISVAIAEGPTIKP